MGEWPIIPLGELVDPERSICYGIVQPGPHVPGGIPILRVNNFSGGTLDTKEVHRVAPAIEKKYTRSRLKGGELLVTLVGSIGQTAFATRAHHGWNVARAVGVLPLRSDVDSRWVNFAIRGFAAQEFMMARANTTVQTTFNLKDLAQLPIPLPPNHERAPMSAVLSALDDKIELNRRMNETLEGLARALFRDWFVDFGPTRAKMAQSATEGATESGIGAKPQNALPAPYLSPALWSLFPDRLDDAGKPEGWEADTLGAIAVSRREGVNPATIHETTPYIGLEHMPRGSIALSDWGQASAVASNKSAFDAGDFLFGKLRPYFHKVGIAPVSGICSTDIIVIQPSNQSWRGFVMACISDADFVAYTDKTSTGTKMPRTSWRTMSKFQIVRPPQDLAQTFNMTVAPMLDRIRANVKESRTLAQTRDLLLPRLMSGELRVAEAARAVEEVL